MYTLDVSVPAGLSIRVRTHTSDPLIRAAIAPLLREAGAVVEVVEDDEADVELVVGPVTDREPQEAALALVADADGPRRRRPA